MTRVRSLQEINTITGEIVDAAFQIHYKIGPGLAESFYETLLARELVRRGLEVERQKRVSFDFEGLWFENVGRVDLVIERVVVVEVKSVLVLMPVHEKQLSTYLRALDCRIGLLINFGAAFLKDGIKRIANL